MHVDNPVYNRERAEQVWRAAYHGHLEQAEEMARSDIADWWDIDHPTAEESMDVVQVHRVAHAVFGPGHATAMDEAGADVPAEMEDGWLINLPRVTDKPGWPQVCSAATWAEGTMIEDNGTGFTIEAGFPAAHEVVCDAGRRHVYAEDMLESIPEEVAHNLSTLYHDRIPETYGDRIIAEFFGALGNELYHDPMEYAGAASLPGHDQPEERDMTLRMGHPVGRQLACRALERGDDPAELVRMSNDTLLERFAGDIREIHQEYGVAIPLDTPDFLVTKRDDYDPA